MCGLARESCANQGAKAQESFVDFKLLQRRVAQDSPPRRARGIVQRFLKNTETEFSDNVQVLR